MALPSEGTASRRIWELADRLAAELGRPPTRAEVCRVPTLADIHPKTVSTQYGAWKRIRHPELSGLRYIREDIEIPEPGTDDVDPATGTGTTVHWAALLKNGFTYLCDWKLTESGSLSLDRDAPDQPGLYAFIVEDLVVYIGTTRRALKARMADYRRGHAGQRTSARVNQLIARTLAEGRVVRVLFATPKDETWNELPVVIAAGLEVGLIEALRPAWNMRGAK